jgi:hypothetical protein
MFSAQHTINRGRIAVAPDNDTDKRTKWEVGDGNQNVNGFSG